MAIKSRRVFTFSLTLSLSHTLTSPLSHALTLSLARGGAVIGSQA